LERLGGTGDLTPEAMVIEGERFAHMLGVVLALPEKERLALLWFKLKGLSHAEIGARLGVSRHNVPNYLARALAKCAVAMEAFERAGLDQISDDGRKRDPDPT
jgi:RNA polymerase sigma factor (sigma-70 family)